MNGYDGIFTVEGAELYKRDLKSVEFHLLDTGHFALEEDLAPISSMIRDFLGRNVPHGEGATMSMVSKDSATIAGEPIGYPGTPDPEITSAVFTIPPGQTSEWMTHPTQGYLFVLEGTLVVERRHIGGSCPSIACLPSKSIIHNAKVAHYFHRAAEFGISVGDWKVEMPAVIDRKRQIVEGVLALNREAYRNTGTTLVMGQGRFVGPKAIEVVDADGGTRILRGEVVVINTGSRARVDPIPGLVEVRPMTHVETLDLDRVPEHLLVLGGGYVGLEMAQAMRRLGSRVTVLERNSALVEREDRDVAEALASLFRDEGVEIRTGVSVDRAKGRSGESVRLYTKRGGSEELIEGTDVLVASGRLPNTDDIGLEAAGIERNSHGFIKVDERCRTTAPGVWAVGDCAGSPHFTHMADDDSRVVADNLAGIDRTTTDRLVPFCLFTDPELARVGLNESEAKSRGIAYRLAKVPVTDAFRSRTISETRGFLKALVAADSDRILGFTAFGPESSGVMTTVQLAIAEGIPYTRLRDSTMTHPTMAEGISALFRAVPERA